MRPAAAQRRSDWIDFTPVMPTPGSSAGMDAHDGTQWPGAPAPVMPHHARSKSACVTSMGSCQAFDTAVPGSGFRRHMPVPVTPPLPDAPLFVEPFKVASPLGIPDVTASSATSRSSQLFKAADKPTSRAPVHAQNMPAYSTDDIMRLFDTPGMNSCGEGHQRPDAGQPSTTMQHWVGGQFEAATDTGHAMSMHAWQAHVSAMHEGQPKLHGLSGPGIAGAMAAARRPCHVPALSDPFSC